MKPYGILVPGSMITEQTAPAYLKRTAGMLYAEFSPANALVLDQIEERIVSAGYLTWDECEELEIAALQELA